MLIDFTKMQGCANDYIYIDCMSGKNSDVIDNISDIAKDMSRRHFSVGADGVVLICDSEVADAKMRMFNADGSEGKMCGNAIRCVGKYMYDNCITSDQIVDIETLSGIKHLDLHVENGICTGATVDMGKASFVPTEIPVLADDEVVNNEIFLSGHPWKITCVSMGNPHAVTFIEDVESLEIEKIGPKFENFYIFPERINTEFIELVDANNLIMRVWERGSGETYACGTGACASVATAIKCGYCKSNSDVVVHLKGGDLVISIDDDCNVKMTGPAKTVYRGVYIYER